MTVAPFRMTVRAEPADIDELGHVNNAVYVRWLQEIATIHWRRVASDDLQARFFWVIVRHEIDYLAPTLAGETLDAETWGENPKGARFDRRIRLTGADGKRRAEARTTWVLMDIAARRPARIPDAVIALFPPVAR